MPFAIDSEELSNYLLLHVKGVVSGPNMKQLADFIRGKCARTGLKKVLLDCREMTGALPLSELFHIGVLYAALISAAGLKLASIGMPPEWKENKFSEDVIANRGGVLRHFETKAEAEAWFDR